MSYNNESQLVSNYRISGEGSPHSQVPRQSVRFCFKGYLFSCKNLTHSYSTTVLNRQTTWANGHPSV